MVTTATKLVSLSAYAQHRRCSKTAVQEAIQSGRLVDSVQGGKIHAELADQEWLDNTDPSQARGPSSEGDESYRDVQIRKVAAQARMAELQVAEREGQLHDVAECDREQSRIARRVRDALLAVPDRYTDEVLSTQDPVKARQVLRKAMREVLTELVAKIEDDDDSAA